MVKAGKIISIAAILLLIVLAVSFSSVQVARAGVCVTDVWVAPPPFGNDGNPGTQAHPFATIQHGIDVVLGGGFCEGGTVHVAAGTYHENLLISGAANLTGAGAPITIIDGGSLGTNPLIGGPVITISSAPNEVNIISGFTIRNGNAVFSTMQNPADENVLYAGIKLPSFQRLPQLIDDGFGDCGGGIFISQTHIVTLNDCVIRDNIANVGGGICNNGRLTMNRCTVSGNTAVFDGGGISNGPGIDGAVSPEIPGPSLGTMSLTNCTISNNRLLGGGIPDRESSLPEGFTGSRGAGIFNLGHMELLNCTIANNSTDSDPDSAGGGFANLAPLTAIFKNTIVANNFAGHPGTDNGFNGPNGVITSLGHNLDSENNCGFDQPTDLINTNPMLGPLADNGGPTFTCALLEGSPAIDTGDDNGAPSTDQRGITRPQGLAVDIGAYEFVPTTEPEVNAGPLQDVSPSNPNNWTRNLNPATMSVAFVSVNPQQVVANQPVTISTNVVNTGDQGGNMSVALKINGIVEQTRMVSVGPQASQPIKFTVARSEPGTYSIDIGGKTGSFIIPDSHSNQGTPLNTGMIIFLVMAVLAIAIVMVLLLNRRSA